MKPENIDIITFIAICTIGVIVLLGLLTDKVIREIQEAHDIRYYHIEQLDCYCRVDHFGKQDLFIDVNGDTVAIVKRK
jgi:hypothetical protein